MKTLEEIFTYADRSFYMSPVGSMEERIATVLLSLLEEGKEPESILSALLDCAAGDPARKEAWEACIAALSDGDIIKPTLHTVSLYADGALVPYEDIEVEAYGSCTALDAALEKRKVGYFGRARIEGYNMTFLNVSRRPNGVVTCRTVED